MLEKIGIVITVGAYVIAGASALAAITPTNKDDVVVGTVKRVWDRVVNVFALNVGNADQAKINDEKLLVQQRLRSAQSSMHKLSERVAELEKVKR